MVRYIHLYYCLDWGNSFSPLLLTAKHRWSSKTTTLTKKGVFGVPTSLSFVGGQRGESAGFLVLMMPVLFYMIYCRSRWLSCER